MKKLLVILLVLCSPCIVLADSASPSIIGYEAVIINKKGAKYDDGTIPYNTKVFVRDEYNYRDGGATIDACLDKESYSDCHEISSKDVAPIKKEVLPKDLSKYYNDGSGEYISTALEKYDSKLLVSNKKGLKLKKGPADAYGEYSVVVPYKKIVKLTYAIIHEIPHSSEYSWFYVDDEEYKGWVSSEALFFKEPIMMFEDVKLYDPDTDKEIDTIPAETIIDEYYSYEKIYLNYKDKFGYIKINYFDHNKDYKHSYYGYKSKLGYIVTTKSIEMKSNGKAITAIPKGEYIKILYAEMEYDSELPSSTDPVCISRNECLYYIEYNGVKGFINDENVISIINGEEMEKTSYDKDLMLYDLDYYYDTSELYEENKPIEEYSKKHETGDIIPANTTVTYYMSYSLDDDSINNKVISGDLRYTIHLVKYNNKLGWVIAEIDDSREFGNENEDKQTIVTPEPVKKGLVMSKSVETIVDCIMCALIASSVAMILLFLVNKNKKPKLVNKSVTTPKDNKVNKDIIVDKQVNNVQESEVVPVKKIKKNKTVNTKKK